MFTIVLLCELPYGKKVPGKHESNILIAFFYQWIIQNLYLVHCLRKKYKYLRICQGMFLHLRYFL